MRASDLCKGEGNDTKKSSQIRNSVDRMVVATWWMEGRERGSDHWRSNILEGVTYFPHRYTVIRDDVSIYSP
eukprot:scaffold12494_cov55-Cyclotella_meneghiniana.AAC.5